MKRLLQRAASLTANTAPLIHRGALALLAVFSIGALGGCGGGGGGRSAAAPAKPATPAGPPGGLVYAQSCARCHGYNLQGRPGTPKLTSARIAGLGDQTLRITIISGKGEMPGFGKLTERQITDLIAYLRTL